MAFKKKSFKKKSFKKKTMVAFKPKTKKLTYNRTMVDLGKGFPKKLTMAHKYTESISMTSVAGAMSTYYFSTNGMYDPNYTGAGHQPMYFDQLTALYDHYCVIGSKITVSFIPTSTLIGSTAVALVVNDDVNLVPTSFPGVIEQTLAKYKYITYNITDPIVLTHKWSAKKYFGGPGILNNVELQGTVTTNPTEQSYYTIIAQSIDGATTNSFWVEVNIEYLVVWKELKDLASS